MPRARDTETPHLAYPMRLEPGGAAMAVTEQDSIEEIRGCAELILRTPIGFVPELPDFGIPDPTFRQLTDGVQDIQAAVEEAEERADALLSEDPDALDEITRRISVDIRGGAEV